MEMCFVGELRFSSSGKADTKCTFIEVLTVIVMQNSYLVHIRAQVSLYQTNTNKCTYIYIYYYY